MSQFNKKLDEAKSQQRRLHFVAGITVVAILLLVASLLVISRGTRVEIIPEEAKQLAEIRVVEGLGFCIGDTVYSLAGNPVIAVSATGFKTAEETIDSAHLGKVFSFELLELPGRLVIEILGYSEIMSKTAWRINGRDTVISNKLDIELNAGGLRCRNRQSVFSAQRAEGGYCAWGADAAAGRFATCFRYAGNFLEPSWCRRLT